jgi:hypothetical protein
VTTECQAYYRCWRYSNEQVGQKPLIHIKFTGGGGVFGTGRQLIHELIKKIYIVYQIMRSIIRKIRGRQGDWKGSMGKCIFFFFVGLRFELGSTFAK